jgi:hypothetical protein
MQLCVVNTGSGNDQTLEVAMGAIRLAEENATWGAPKIHGELQKLRADYCIGDNRNTAEE